MNLLIYILFVAYFFGIFQIFSIGNFGVSPVYLVLLLIYAVFTIRLFFNQVKIESTHSKTGNILLLMLLVVTLSVITTLSTGYQHYLIQFVKTYSHLWYLSLFTLICCYFSFDNRIWKKVFKLILVASLFINLFGIYQLFARAYDLPLAWLDVSNISVTARGEVSDNEEAVFNQLSLKFGNFFRATSIFYEPSALAGFNLYIISLLMYPFFINAKYKIFNSSFLLYSISFISIITLFLTFSLTGVLGLILIGTIFILFFKKIRFSRLVSYLLVSALTLYIVDLIAASYFSTSVLDLFTTRIANITGISETSIVGESVGTRYQNFLISVDTWLKSPFIGIGLGQTYLFAEIGFSDYGIMHVLMEGGIFSAILFLGLFIYSFFEVIVIRNYIHLLDDTSEYLLTTSMFLLIMLFMFNFITGNGFIAYNTWIFLGLILSVITNARRVLYKKGVSIKLFKGFRVGK